MSSYIYYLSPSGSNYPKNKVIRGPDKLWNVFIQGQWVAKFGSWHDAMELATTNRLIY